MTTGQIYSYDRLRLAQELLAKFGEGGTFTYHEATMRGIYLKNTSILRSLKNGAIVRALVRESGGSQRYVLTERGIMFARYGGFTKVPKEVRAT
jgi:hypothetical protein